MLDDARHRGPDGARDRAQEARDRLLPLGLAVTLREFEMGHEISAEALRALLEWFEDKVFGMIRPEPDHSGLVSEPPSRADRLRVPIGV